MATIQEIQKQIEKWEASLAQVRESQQKGQARVSELETERRGLIVEARTKKNEAAKKRITAIAGELDATNRELHDDADAVTECTNRLEPLRADLALATRLAERERLLKFIAVRADKDRPSRIAKLVRELEDEVAAWTADKAAVASAITQFDPRLRPIADAVRAQYVDPVGIKYLYPTKEYLDTFAGIGHKIFDQGRAAIEAHLLPGEPVPSDRRAYRAKAGARFDVHGLAVHGGDTLYLLPEHATYYVQEGLLIEEGEPEARAEQAAVARDPQPPVDGTNKRQVFV